MADANNPISDATAAPRLARLDGLRGIAACGVAFTYHAWALFRDDAFAPGNPLVEWLHWSGWLFVDMFFVLSGYIFAHVYLSRGLLLTAALFWGKPENTPLAFLAHLAMLQALVPPVAQTFDGPTWSLSVEAVCYMLFAVGAAAGPQALRRVTLFAILLGVAALALHAAPYGPFVRDNFPRGLLGFFLGQALWHQRARLGTSS